MNVVFVGGCVDGRREVLPDDRTRHEVATFTRTNTEIGLMYSSIRKEIYYKFPLFPKIRAVIFAHESLMPEQVLEKLLDGYRS